MRGYGSELVAWCFANRYKSMAAVADEKGIASSKERRDMGIQEELVRGDRRYRSVLSCSCPDSRSVKSPQANLSMRHVAVRHGNIETAFG